MPSKKPKQPKVKAPIAPPPPKPRDVEGDVADEAGGFAACGAALVAHDRACDGRGGHGDVHLGGSERGAGRRGCRHWRESSGEEVDVASGVWTHTLLVLLLS